MTLFDLIRAMRRRWPLVSLGIVATAVLAFVSISDRGVYDYRFEIVLLAPTSTAYPNALKTQSEDIIDTAGVVVKRMTGAGKVTKFNSSDVSLVGTGVRDGWSPRQPDTGGQWGTNFTTQTMILEVVAADVGTVQARQSELLGQIKSELDNLQDEQGVDPINYITMSVAPSSPVSYHVGGNRYRALGMTGLLGAGITIGIVVLLENRGRAGVRPRRSKGEQRPAQARR